VCVCVCVCLFCVCDVHSVYITCIANLQYVTGKRSRRDVKVAHIHTHTQIQSKQHVPAHNNMRPQSHAKAHKKSHVPHAHTHTHAHTHSNGDCYLFFGNRYKKKDFLYESEWASYIQRGGLTQLIVAFSRDDPVQRTQTHTHTHTDTKSGVSRAKVYVWHKMRETRNRQLIWRCLAGGGYIFVAGWVFLCVWMCVCWMCVVL